MALFTGFYSEDKKLTGKKFIVKNDLSYLQMYHIWFATGFRLKLKTVKPGNY